MHMADALISPTAGGTLWAVSAGLLAFCARKIRASTQEHLVPLMGVLGAFIFASQMINVAIPGTGSSGHLSGGLILAVLLGPYAAFLVIASVLTVQALFFADGGLLALGCNIFNMGFFASFIAYPLIYRPLARGEYNTPRAWGASLAAAIVALQLGALAVVLETTMSGISELNFSTFALLMQPIHLGIGIIEGLVTAAVVAFVGRARPEIVSARAIASVEARSVRPVYIGLIAATLLIGGVVSWFASSHPDGLEWSVEKITGGPDLPAPEKGAHLRLAEIQGKSALLPDYDFKSSATADNDGGEVAWLAVRAGTTVSGIVGGALTMLFAVMAGLLVRRRIRPHGQTGG